MALDLFFKLRLVILMLLTLTPIFALGQGCCGTVKIIETQVNTIDTRTQNLRTATEQVKTEVGLMTKRILTSEETIERSIADIQKNQRLLDSLNKKAAILTQEVEEITTNLGKNREANTVTEGHLNRFWIMIAAILVFFMQAGFKALEVGMVRRVHRDGVGLKNLIDWMAVCLVFYLVGFGFMFGESVWGVIGFSLFLPTSADMASINSAHHLEFFLFQLAFAATAATIVSGAMSERTYLRSYLALAVMIALCIYPVFGHWAWGNIFTNNELDDVSGDFTQPWLVALKFHDFAGSTVVHSIGAWVALAGIIKLGPRTNRFKPGFEQKFAPSNLSYSVLGVLILWMGWWGFNGGSTLEYGDKVSFVILNTNLSAVTAGLMAYFIALSRDKENSFVKLIGGVLGGLVAITACCDVVSPLGAIAIGAVAGIVHNLGMDLLKKWQLDDPVGAIPVHGFCGVWGTLAVAIFAKNEMFQPDGIFETLTKLELFGVQLLGVLVAFIFAFGVGWLFITLIDHLFALRINEEAEDRGGYN